MLGRRALGESGRRPKGGLRQNENLLFFAGGFRAGLRGGLACVGRTGSLG